MEKLEPLYIADGNVEWCSSCGSSLVVPQKVKWLPYDLAILLLVTYEEMKAGTQTGICTPVFIIHNSQKVEAAQLPISG